MIESLRIFDNTNDIIISLGLFVDVLKRQGRVVIRYWQLNSTVNAILQMTRKPIKK